MFIDSLRKVEFFMVKGYKALDEDMKAILGDGMHYEIGKWYEVDGEIKPCENGFHFCRKLEDIHGYYDLFHSRLFEIEADGKIMEASNTKMVCSKIRLVREILPEEWQTEKNLLKILKIDGWAIQSIKSPTIEMQLEAVKQNGRAIYFIENPTVEVQLAAVKQNGYAIQLIEKPAPEVLTYLQKKTVNHIQPHNGGAFFYVKIKMKNSY